MVRAEGAQRSIDARVGGGAREVEGRALAVEVLAGLRDEYELLALPAEQRTEPAFGVPVCRGPCRGA